MARFKVGTSETFSTGKRNDYFEVNDMTCGHCVSTITKAVKAEDSSATVHIDLATHRVAIETASGDVHALGEVIKGAGYTPVVVEGTVSPAPAPATAARARSCGCGCG